MAAHGINSVRVYTSPPRWLLDLAAAQNLRVLVGLCWEQHVAFLESRAETRAKAEAVRGTVRASAGHPAVLAYAIGNEVPASIVRWYGRRRIEAWLQRLFEIAKHESPESLVTYVSYPTTEYLELPFFDFASFNVYLESRDSPPTWRASTTGGRTPVCELGIDSMRRQTRQARRSPGSCQNRSTQAAPAPSSPAGPTAGPRRREIATGPSGSWTASAVKRALAAVSELYAKPAATAGEALPLVSVVCCSYNGEPTIRDTLEGLAHLDYPRYEVIVVDDGSTDATAEIARGYGARVISTPNQGLSAARNVGMRAASGEIVAYIDDDAYPDPGWLTFLVRTFREGGFCGVGGPNLLPREDGPLAECVANAPGGPCHVLLSDREAEHIPGCNMAFQRTWLERIGGFDSQFRSAGDDVDLCWRLQELGGRIGFHPAAIVWHHRRSSLRRYWKQQVGYGTAEALLARKWPQKYNNAAHIPWSGRIYGRGLTLPWLRQSGRVYQGVWGSAPFQSVYQPAPGRLLALTLMPEWYALLVFLAALSLLSWSWPLLRPAIPLLALTAAAVVLQAVRSAAHARLRREGRARAQRVRLRAVIAWLHLMQPAARLWGRLWHGLDPLRLRRLSHWVLPKGRQQTLWSEAWRDLGVAGRARAGAAVRGLVRHGGDFDRWDLSLAGGLFGRARVLMTVEEHGQGRQYLRFRIWPKVRHLSLLLAAVALAGAALLDEAWLPALLLGPLALALLATAVRECGAAEAEIIAAVAGLKAPVAAQVPQALPAARQCPEVAAPHA
jgi:GT2 family glycosyltransferase